MRLQLNALVLAVAAFGGSELALADGDVTITGAYYKERSTRVIQPMFDGRFEIGNVGELSTHLLVDSITSASPASGAGGAAFTETRTEAGGTYTHLFKKFRLGGGVRYSNEPDYKSFFGLIRGEAELADKNTTLGITLAQGRDRVSNAGAQLGMVEPISGRLNTSLAAVSLTQVMSQYVIAAVTYDITYLDGFLENAYRVVPAEGRLEPERVPDRRVRNAVFGSVRGYIPPSRTAVMVGYRAYADTWDVWGHTPEIRIYQELGPDVLAQARYRYHRQTSADFYEDVYDSADPLIEPFLTSDPKLDRLTTHGLSLKTELKLKVLGFKGALADIRGGILVEYMAQSSRFGDAISAQFAMSIPLRY